MRSRGTATGASIVISSLHKVHLLAQRCFSCSYFININSIADAPPLYRGGSRKKYLGEGARQKVDDLFLVVALKTRAKTTKSTTPTLQKTPLYNCLLVLLLHNAAVSKDLGGGQGSGLGGLPFPCPNVKLLLLL